MTANFKLEDDEDEEQSYEDNFFPKNVIENKPSYKRQPYNKKNNVVLELPKVNINNENLVTKVELESFTNKIISQIKDDKFQKLEQEHEATKKLLESLLEKKKNKRTSSDESDDTKKIKTKVV
jgi:hypothetical protein